MPLHPLTKLDHKLFDILNRATESIFRGTPAEEAIAEATQAAYDLGHGDRVEVEEEAYQRGKEAGWSAADEDVDELKEQLSDLEEMFRAAESGIPDTAVTQLVDAIWYANQTVPRDVILEAVHRGWELQVAALDREIVRIRRDHDKELAAASRDVSDDLDKNQKIIADVIGAHAKRTRDTFRQMFGKTVYSGRNVANLIAEGTAYATALRMAADNLESELRDMLAGKPPKEEPASAKAQQATSTSTTTTSTTTTPKASKFRPGVGAGVNVVDRLTTRLRNSINESVAENLNKIEPRADREMRWVDGVKVIATYQVIETKNGATLGQLLWDIDL